MTTNINHSSSPAQEYLQLFPAVITSVQQNLVTGVFYYSFVEQSFDPTLGKYFNSPYSARAGDAQNGPYLTEVNNQFVNPGTVVWVRLKGVVQGLLAYEFSATQPLAWVRVTGASSQQVTLGGQFLANMQNSVLTAQFPIFQPELVGASVTGSGIPNNTTITAINGPFQATLSNTASGKGVLVQMDTSTIAEEQLIPTFNAYTGVITVWDNWLGRWQDTNMTVWYFDANNSAPLTGNVYQCRLQGSDYDGVQIWCHQTDGFAWVKVLFGQNTPQKIYLGHQVQANLTLGSSTVTITNGYVTSNDVGAMVLGLGVPDNTTISSVSTGKFVMSANATATETNVTLSIYNGSILGYEAHTDFWGKQGTYGFHNAGDPNPTQNCWLLNYNQPDVNAGATEPHNLYPLQSALQPFLCVQVATDYQGWPIFVWPYDPGAFWDTGPSTAPSGMTSSIVTYGLPFNSNSATPARITMGYGTMVEGFTNDDGSATGQDTYVAPGSIAVSQGVAPAPYLCDTGTDATGNQIVNGRIVSIGGNNVTLNGIDGGTW